MYKDLIEISVPQIMINYDIILSDANHNLVVAKAELSAWKTECLEYRKNGALSAPVQEEPRGE